MPHQRVRRILGFLATLEKADPCDSREDAFNLIRSTWLAVNLDSSVPDKDLEIFRQMQLRAEDGWKNLESDPCYLDSIEHSGLSLYLHLDGSIVIQDLSCPSHTILLSKPCSKKPKTKAILVALPLS